MIKLSLCICWWSVFLSSTTVKGEKRQRVVKCYFQRFCIDSVLRMLRPPCTCLCPFKGLAVDLYAYVTRCSHKVYSLASEMSRKGMSVIQCLIIFTWIKNKYIKYYFKISSPRNLAKSLTILKFWTGLLLISNGVLTILTGIFVVLLNDPRHIPRYNLYEALMAYLMLQPVLLKG
jgi:hypothetical protein